MTARIRISVLAALWISGCTNDRVVDIAERASDRQAEQNTEMARVNREVAEGSNNLVTADAEARKEMLAANRDIQAERRQLNDGFNDLEAERKQMAADRRTESLLLPVAQLLGVIVVAAVVIGFCWTLLFGLRATATSDAEVAELLIQELASQRPQLLPLNDDRDEQPRIADR